jgi:sugar lactone lactonase YvrE
MKMRNKNSEISAGSRRDTKRFGFCARALLLSAGAFAIILAQTANVNAGKKADGRPLWVPNAGGDTIVEFTTAQRAASGSPVPEATIDSAALDFPTAVVFDPSGNMWVANAGAPDIIEFTATQLVDLGATPNPAPAVTVTTSGLEDPLADFDKSGNLWVTDHDTDEIFEFSKKQLKTGGDITPKVTISSSDLNGARNIAFDHKGNLWISNDVSNQIVEFAKKGLAKGGTLTPAVIISDDGSESLDDCKGIAFDSDHNLWVANAANSTVVELAASSLKTTGSPTPPVTIGASDGSLSAPVGIGFDDKGNLWVSNFSGATVVEFSPSQITSSGTPTPTVTISNTSDSLDGPEQFSFGF